MNLLEVEKLTERETKVLKDMAYTALNNDLEIFRNHKSFHLQPWMHQNCVHCQIKANKLKK